MRRRIITVLYAALMAVTASAQGTSTFHDDPVMQQFTVGEIGIGNLGSGFFTWYYDVFHPDYRQWAAAENKELYRILTYYSWYRELPMAEEIDSCLKERAKIEGYNLIDRQVDLAWPLEQAKVENKKAVFLRNINRISTLGGSAQDYKRWQNIYEAIDCGLRNVKDSYLPNSERQKSYLAIYKDLVKYNTDLCILLADLDARRKLKGISDAKVPTPRTSIARHASDAFQRWKAAWHGGGNSASNGIEAK